LSASPLTSFQDLIQLFVKNNAQYAHVFFIDVDRGLIVLGSVSQETELYVSIADVVHYSEIKGNAGTVANFRAKSKAEAEA
jgi:hypothetical protein